MSKPISSAQVNLDINAGRPGSQSAHVRTPAERDKGLAILLLGDFSGRENKLNSGPDQRQPVRVDRDNFEEVISRLDVRANLRLGSAGTQVSLRFRELADFEPDRIHESCDLFRNVASSPSKPAKQAPPEPAVTRPDLRSLSTGSLLDNIVEASVSEQPRRRDDELQSMVEKIVAPYLTKKEENENAAASNENAAVLMRAILHHPQFQALEAAWRAVWKLVADLDTDSQLKFYVIDVSKTELAAERSLGAIPLTGPRGERWGLLAGNYVFERTAGDINLLAKLGALASSLGAPFLAESLLPDDAGIDDQDWQALRRAPEARWLGLALPRFLLRRPYTIDSYAVESMRFDEMPPRPDHRYYLWGNPAFACAYLIGRAFNEYGWDFRPGIIHQIDNLPLHTYTADGEIYAQPCAEMLMTDQQVELILEQGLMPLVPIKGTDAIRLIRFQSISEPLTPLAGPWN